MPTELNTSMSQHTTEKIDAEHRAIHHPAEASTADIAAALEGQCLQDVTTFQSLEAVCQRTREKNQKRKQADLGRKDERLEDGDRVTLHAGFHNQPELPPHWAITRLDRAEQPHRDFDDWCETGTALIRATATFHRVDSDPVREHVVDVTVTDYSPASEGPQTATIEKEQQQYTDEDDLPGSMTVIDREPEDPPANWPQSERVWLNDLIDKHGPLVEPVYHLDAGTEADDRAGGSTF